MSKLIVDDAGNQRAFRLGEGRLTIGSGENDKLRLQAGGVEPGHLTLVVRGQSVSIDATAPVELAGEELVGEHRWHGGQTLAVGDARFSFVLEGDGPKAPAGARAPKRPATREVDESKAPTSRRSTAGSAVRSTGVRSSGGRSRASRSDEGDDGAPRRRGSASSRARQQQGGLPSWAMPVGVIALLGGVLVWYSFKGGGAAQPAALLNQASSLIDDGQSKTARSVFAKLDRDKLSTDLKARYDEVEKKFEARLLGKTAEKRMRDSIDWATLNLTRFHSKYLENPLVQAGQVRMWFENLAQFREENPDTASTVWQENPSGKKLLGEIAAIEAQFKDHPGRSGPANLDDARWWIEYYTSGGKGGDGTKLYAPVLAKLDEVQAVSSELDAESVETLRSQVLADRTLYVEQKLARSKELFERYLVEDSLPVLQQSAAELVNLIHYNREAGIRNTAANALIKFPMDKLQKQLLPSYEKHDPSKYASLMEVPQIAGLTKLIGGQTP